MENDNNSPPQLLLPPGLINIIIAQKNCLDDFLLFGNVMSVLSFILSAIAAIVLYRKPKMRNFPHCMPLLLCISSVIHFSGEVLSVFSTDEALLENFTLCWTSGFLSHFGLILVFWIWITSFIILYQATVLKVYIFHIRENKLRYIIPLTLWITFLMAVPLSIRTYEFTLENSRCVLIMDSEWLVFLFSVGWLATIMFLIFAPGIIKALLTSDNLILARRRVLMLRQEAIRQVLLGFAMFLTAAISGYRYGITVLVVEHASGSINSAWFQNLFFTSCALDIIWDRQFGVWIALIYLISIENYNLLKKFIKTKFSSANSSNDPEQGGSGGRGGDHRFAREEEMEDYYNVIKTPRSCASGMPGAVSAHSVAPPNKFNTATTTPEVYMSYLMSLVRQKLEIDGMILTDDDTQLIVENVASTFTSAEGSSINDNNLPEDLDERVELAQRKWIQDNIIDANNDNNIVNLEEAEAGFSSPVMIHKK